jgi:hypothetical protein
MRIKPSKTIIPIILFLLTLNTSFRKKNKNEIKTNALYAALGVVDIHYERITGGKYSLGASCDINLRWEEFLTSFVVFGRAYTSEEAKHLFFEIHHAIHLDGSCSENQVINYIGPGFGYKTILKNNFTVEFFAGIGIHYLKIDCKELGNTNFPRLGILVGKRF